MVRIGDRNITGPFLQVPVLWQTESKSLLVRYPAPQISFSRTRQLQFEIDCGRFEPDLCGCVCQPVWSESQFSVWCSVISHFDKLSKHTAVRVSIEEHRTAPAWFANKPHDLWPAIRVKCDANRHPLIRDFLWSAEGFGILWKHHFIFPICL
jgi:hypothetical protein